MKEIVVKDKVINITGISDDDYVSLTDIAKIKSDNANVVIMHWMRRVDSLGYLSLWETINNTAFKPTDFGGFKSKPGENAFIITPKKWIELTNAIGIKVKSGKYGGGTFAHRDIALEFASWISPEVKLYIIKEFQRLKLEENEQLEWNNSRIQSKINYLIHTTAIKEYLVPIELTNEQKHYVYASEADMLNVALFGLRAKEWEKLNPNKKGNMRDYASAIELNILSNLEFYNSVLIKDGVSQSDRLVILNESANKQKELINKNKYIK